MLTQLIFTVQGSLNARYSFSSLFFSRSDTLLLRISIVRTIATMSVNNLYGHNVISSSITISIGRDVERVD